MGPSPSLSRGYPPAPRPWPLRRQRTQKPGPHCGTGFYYFWTGGLVPNRTWSRCCHSLSVCDSAGYHSSSGAAPALNAHTRAAFTSASFGAPVDTRPSAESVSFVDGEAVPEALRRQAFGLGEVGVWQEVHTGLLQWVGEYIRNHTYPPDICLGFLRDQSAANPQAQSDSLI